MFHRSVSMIVVLMIFISAFLVVSSVAMLNALINQSRGESKE